jgi:hypothetical protein
MHCCSNTTAAKASPASPAPVWEGGAVATNTYEADLIQGFMTLVTSGVPNLVTSGVELTAGKHYWEVEILDDSEGPVFVDVARPNLDLNSDYAVRANTDGWFMYHNGGGLFGNNWAQP